MTNDPKVATNPAISGHPLPEPDQEISEAFIRNNQPTVSELEQRLAQLIEEHGIVSESDVAVLEKNDPLRYIRAEQDVLTGTIALAQSSALPEIATKKKDWSESLERSTVVPIVGYALEYQGKPLVWHKGGRMDYIMIAEGLDKPFRLHGVDRQLFYGDEPGLESGALGYTNYTVSFIEKDSYVASGVPLTGTAARVAEAFFTPVSQFKKVTPKSGKRIIKEVLEQEEQASGTTEATSRHFGQQHLAEKQPFHVDSGVIFGSGEHCKAYWFGSPENAAIVVESNRTNVATLIVTPEVFRKIGEIDRQDIRDNTGSIEGLIARIVHTPGADTNEGLQVEWRIEVDQALAPYMKAK